MSSPRILAIVLNWRQADLTIECVQTLRKMDGPQFDLLVIDNGSGDGSAALLKERLPHEKILALPANLGFAAGANVGLRTAIEHSYEIALLINNDAFPDDQVLVKLLEANGDGIALLSPKILYAGQPDRIWFAGGSQHPQLLEMRNRGLDEKDGPQWNVSRDVDYLLGTFLMVNLAAAKEVGLFDERYFMFYEDLDWSIRFRRKNLRLRLVAQARVYHRVSTSTGGSIDPLNRYYLARSSILFFSKFAHLGKPGLIVLYRLGSSIKSVLSLVLAGHIGAARGYLSGIRDGLILARKRPTQ